MSIRMTDLTKRYGSQLVVSHVSLEVQDGELFVLLGRSGSGKSTILRMVAGLAIPDAGQIVLDGVDVTYLAPQQRGVGFVFQNYSVFRHMSAAANIEFGLRIRGEPAAVRRQRVEELLEVVGLVGLGDRFADQLSGGQLQRVALARALAYRPAVLLLDEPFGALDVKIRGQLRLSLKEIQDRLGVTTILVTHDQEEAFALADRIGILEHGHLVEIATPAELYHRPRSEYAGSFVGSGNVLAGSVREGAIQLGSARWPFPKGAPAHEEGRPVRVLFRPESVVLQTAPFQGQGEIFSLGRGEVRASVFAGASLRVQLELEGLRGVRPLAPPVSYGQDKTIIEALVPSRSAGATGEPGQQFWVGVRDYHVLDPSGLRVLVLWDPSPQGSAALDAGGRIARVMGGQVGLLAVAGEGRGAGPTERSARRWLEEQQSPWPAPELRVRQAQGSSGPALEESQAGEYDLVVLPRSLALPAGELLRDILEIAILPALVVGEPMSKLDRILIGTGGGEPGKADVVFGGRLARNARARVTVFHFHPPEAEPLILERGQRHLEQARASLEALGVAAESVLAAHPRPAQGILDRLAQGEFDLLVIGAPAPRDRRQTRWTDLTSPIVQGATRPVLIVPSLD